MRPRASWRESPDSSKCDSGDPTCKRSSWETKIVGEIATEKFSALLLELEQTCLKGKARATRRRSITFLTAVLRDHFGEDLARREDRPAIRQLALTSAATGHWALRRHHRAPWCSWASWMPNGALTMTAMKFGASIALVQARETKRALESCHVTALHVRNAA